MSTSKKPKTLSTAIRYLQILQLLTRKRSWGTRDLHEALEREGVEVSMRTVQRDLQALQSVFPNLKSYGPKTQLTWRWDKNAPVNDIPGWDLNLAIAMSLAEQHLSKLLPPQVLEDLRPYFDKAAAMLAVADDRITHWQDKVAMISRSMPLLPPDVDDAILSAVYDALLREQPLTLHYRNRSNEQVEATFSPLGLVVQEQVLYLVGTFWDYTDIRHLAVHRIQSAVIDPNATYHRPQGFNFKRYLEDGPFHYPVSDGLLPLRLRMRAYTAKHLQESPLSVDQKILHRHEDPDWVIISASVPDTQQLRWWLLSLGDQVEVLDPLPLRAEMAAIVSNLHGRYSSGA